MSGNDRSPCCDAPLKVAFYGGVVCSDCRTDFDPEKVLT